MKACTLLFLFGGGGGGRLTRSVLQSGNISQQVQLKTSHRISHLARVKGKVVSYRLIKIQTCPHKPAEGRFLLQTITEVLNTSEILAKMLPPPLGLAHYYADS